MLRRLFAYSGSCKKYIILLPIVIIAEVFLEVLIPYFMAEILDEGITNGMISELARVGIIMAVVSLSLVLTGMAQSYFVSHWAEGCTKNLRNSLFSKIQQLSFSDIDTIGKASLITRISTDISFIKKALHMVHSLIKCPIMIIFTLVMAIKINRSIWWIFSSAILLFAVVLLAIIKFSKNHYKEMFERYDSMNTVLEEDIVNIRTIKAFERGEYEVQRFNKIANEVKKESYAAEKIVALNNPILQLAVNICVILLLYFGGFEVVKGSMTSGDLFCLITYTNQILGQIMIIALILVPILTAQVSLERVFSVLEYSVPAEKNNETEEPEDGTILFKNVSFGYFGEDETKFVLRDVSFEIPSCSVLGIIGASGSSKTTLVNLLMRFYEINHGTIYVGNRDIKNLTLCKLRSFIGFVPQSNVLFSGTIRENLLFGNPESTEADLISACKVADAYEYISKFPDGFDTMLSEGGTNLSGGQRQRLCIARALVKKPKILVFDDSLSAVDTVTGMAINKALKEQFYDTTIIMIAQRISSIQSADKILVMDDGMISGFGTHDELIKSNRLYSEIYETQKKTME